MNGNKMLVITRWGRVLRFIFRGNFQACSFVSYHVGKVFPGLKRIYREQPIMLKADEAPVTKFMQTYDIHVDLAPTIGDHIAFLRRKYPQMSSARILRKTADYFRLKVKTG